jgi:hypothetical protein
MPTKLSTHEKIFGEVMLGVILGTVAWALLGALWGLYFGDDYTLLLHWGGRAMMYGDSFAPGF